MWKTPHNNTDIKEVNILLWFYFNKYHFILVSLNHKINTTLGIIYPNFFL